MKMLRDARTVVPSSWQHFHSGKVRDTFLGPNESTLRMVVTDRISAFDVVLPTLIPDKGRVLAGLTAYWCTLLRNVVPNHFLGIVALYGLLDKSLTDRVMEVLKATRIPIEAVVRGHLAGSAWSEYKRYRTIFGKSYPSGLLEGSALPQPIFTPTTKAEVGHDQPINEEEGIRLILEADPELAYTAAALLYQNIKNISLKLFNQAYEHALERGLILVDTKFEFGLLPGGDLLLIDEVLTPDSSRFWDAEQFSLGQSQPSYDKQFVRDYLESLDWNKQPPAPHLPVRIVQQTRERYLECYRMLTGRGLS